MKIIMEIKKRILNFENHKIQKHGKDNLLPTIYEANYEIKEKNLEIK